MTNICTSPTLCPSALTKDGSRCGYKSLRGGRVVSAGESRRDGWVTDG